jgi:hypothetical protein
VDAVEDMLQPRRFQADIYIMIFSHIEILFHASCQVHRTESQEGLQYGASDSGSEVQLPSPPACLYCDFNSKMLHLERQVAL